MSDLEKLTKQRSVAKGNISRIRNSVSASMSVVELECRLSLVEAYFKNILNIQNDIEVLNPLDTGRADLEDLCIETKSKVIGLLGDNYKRSNADFSLMVPASTNKLPSLDLPKFEGKYSTYCNFIDSFKQLVDSDSSLSQIEKFNHLLHCLQGQALDTVKAFQVTTDNYAKALERLNERYNNTTLMFLEHISNFYDLPEIRDPSARQLRSLIDNASAIFASLKSLSTVEDICNSLVIHILLKKVDKDTRVKWRETLDFSKLPEWGTFTKHIERRCQFLETREAPESPRMMSNNNKRTQGKSFYTQQKGCAICKISAHWISGCTKFKEMEVASRFEEVKKLDLCVNCLSAGHNASKCRSKHKCRVCDRNHHTLLHRGNPMTTFSDISNNETPGSSNAQINTHIANTSVILATAVVLVADASGEYKPGRALLDSGSQVNLITENFSNILNLKRTKSHTNISGISGSPSKINFQTKTTIRSRYNKFQLDIGLFITPRLSSYLPESECNTSHWNIPSHINLADESFYRSQAIDLLLGADAFFEALCSGQIKLGMQLPVVQETRFGWIVSGRYKTTTQSLLSSFTTINLEDESLNAQLEKLWVLDAVSSPRSTFTEEQQACEISFTTTVNTAEDGRIVVQLPFKDDPALLGSSYDVAVKRFLALEKRLSQQPDVKSLYMHFMQEYEDLGHMSLVEDASLAIPHYYLPHHCVLKPSSTSTKLRVVFDASALTSSHVSLNDVLMVGPTIQTDLYKLLLRFRLRKYAVTGDIVKMYRAVLMHPAHSAFQRILWRKSKNQQLRTYELNTITYGMSSSPFLAIRSLHYIADQWADSFSKGSAILKSDFYVDDMLSGADTIQDLQRNLNETTTLLSSSGFELAKIKSNCSIVCEDVNQGKDLNIEPTITSALGITWRPSDDNFEFAFAPKKRYKSITKRSILALTSSIFDPMGLICPIIIYPKILLQDLWIAKIPWDTEVPNHIRFKFESFIKDLSHLTDLKIPRYVLRYDWKHLQLHGFCDASLRAYGCCFYVRVETQDGSTFVQLFTAKCRVAPTKKKTLPQLELCSAHLLSELYNKIAHLFVDFPLQTYLWSDSSIVLHWLKLHSSTLTTFVGNRISAIQEKTQNCTWGHVPTAVNPADIVSRGSTTVELITSKWFSGPEFLRESSCKWPTLAQSDTLNNADYQSAIRKVVLKCEAQPNAVLALIERTSSYLRLLRIIGWLLRSFKRQSMSASSSELLPSEIQHALHCVIWNVQQHYFAEELRNIEQGRPVQGSLKSLTPFINQGEPFKL